MTWVTTAPKWTIEIPSCRMIVNHCDVETIGKGVREWIAEKNLRRMIQFAEILPDEKMVVSLIRQLSWTHFIALIPLKDPVQREFYAEMCRIERRSVRALRPASMLYKRTALINGPWR